MLIGTAERVPRKWFCIEGDFIAFWLFPFGIFTDDDGVYTDWQEDIIRSMANAAGVVGVKTKIPALGIASWSLRSLLLIEKHVHERNVPLPGSIQSVWQPMKDDFRDSMKSFNPTTGVVCYY